MKLTCVLFILAVAISTATAAVPRIVGGQPTTIERYPGIVQVEMYSLNWFLTCAANILNVRYLLSAAVCFSNGPNIINNRRIRAGATNRGSGGTIYYLARILNHPTYGKSGFDGDISLIRTNTDLMFSSKVQPVSFASRIYELEDDVPVVHVGWGRTSHGGTQSSVLLEVTTKAVNWETCRRIHNTGVTNNMICSGLQGIGSKGPCQGDGGGPMYYENVLVGIVSWGVGCGNKDYPWVHTKVAAYADWILANAV